MQNQIAQFTNAELIAELQRRHYRTDLLFSLSDVEDAIYHDDEVREIKKEKLIEILESIDTESAWDTLMDSLQNEVAPILFYEDPFSKNN